ncbi:MAG TPA: periplasmic heavy metal sensor [Xanthobacteraceae bacterium]|nr:periplasmic heavy metal sensor [Xanthobacteraceae bacterium]
MVRFLLISFALLIGVAPSSAQHVSPYADLQARPIKALSAQQIADLRAGRGMGLALAAELNGYPGPLHVIELAAQLELSTAQRQRMETLFAEMKAEASALGETLINDEAALDRLFARREINADALVAATNKIGATQAALRASHLKYHLATVDVLRPEQVKKYAELRGYNAGHTQPEQKHRH